MNNEYSIYRKLFTTMFMISACTFGGGFVIISLMKKKFSEDLKWISNEEVLDLAAIAQSAPGALAVNSAIIFGYRIKGFKGALVAVFATVLPPLMIISLISLFYAQFKENEIVQIVLQVTRAGVAAVIIDVVITLALNIFKSKNMLFIAMMAVTFTASYFFRLSAVTIILLCALIGLITNALKQKKARDVQ